MTQGLLFTNEPACMDSRIFFELMTPERRQVWKARYEELLAIEAGTYEPKTNPYGKQASYPTRMSWMVPAWKKGLEIIKKVIQEKDHESGK